MYMWEHVKFAGISDSGETVPRDSQHPLPPPPPQVAETLAEPAAGPEPAGAVQAGSRLSTQVPLWDRGKCGGRCR